VPTDLRHTTATRLKQAIRRARMHIGVRSAQTDNVAYNRELWNWHAQTWDEQLIRLDVQRQRGSQYTPSRLKYLGEEWSTVEEIRWILDEYIYPHVGTDRVVGEIGTGGARIAAQVVDRAGEFTCFDIAEKMLARARAVIGERENVRYVVLDGARLPSDAGGHFDFLYSFDVFVHLDLHTQWKYLREISRALKPGGRAFLHTANLAAPGGWARFAEQDHFAVQGFYFVSPEIVDAMLTHTDLKLIKRSEPNPQLSLWHHTNQDYLFVVEKAGGTTAHSEA